MSATLGTEPPVSICVLTYSDYPQLARRCIDSILRHCDRDFYRLIVGANAVGTETKKYLEDLHQRGVIDELILSPVNLNKNPMMRLMFQRVHSEFIWWFDDDSSVTSDSALQNRLEMARESGPEVAMWGQVLFCDSEGFCNDDPVAFVRTASWYRGLTPPFPEPGGKGELDFEGTGRGNPQWYFVAGGEWFCRTASIRELDWPDRRLTILGDDVFLGEAVRQQGWQICNLGVHGVVINGSERRWQRPASIPIPNQNQNTNKGQTHVHPY